MTKFEFDWSYIRRHTLVPTVTLAVAAVAAVASVNIEVSQTEYHEQLIANQLVMQEDYSALIYRRRLVDRYHRRYQQFSELGFVGMESRLDWIETLREASTELTLPRVSYVMEPQLRAVAPVQSILAGEDISIHVSKLELEMGLVHELDLLRFVDELQEKAPGLIKVDSCDLSWQQGEEGKLRAQPNILASCSVEIYSVITSDVAAGGAT